METVSRTTLWRRVKDGSVPEPIKLGKGTTNFWKESDIDRIIEGEKVHDNKNN